VVRGRALDRPDLARAARADARSHIAAARPPRRHLPSGISTRLGWATAGDDASAESAGRARQREEAQRIARRHQAKAYELRAATTLARLWGEQVRRASARDLLGPVCGWFTEGFDTADLKEAKTLLTELA
jgi:hypothetical protein